MTLKLKFNLILGAPIEGMSEPILKEGIPLPPPPPPLPEGEKRKIVKIPQSVVLSDDTGSWEGIYCHPTWGELPATDVSVSDNHIAFSAPSGNDDKNGVPVMFHFSFVRVDSTDNVVGFSGGQSPFFRSFLPAEGLVTEEKQ